MDIRMLNELIEYAIRKKEQGREASIRYYKKVKDTPEYKEKRKKWNKEQHQKKMAKKKVGEATQLAKTIIT